MSEDLTLHRNRPVTHEQARESVQRLVNSHFKLKPQARVQIPAHPDDDDLVATRYVMQQEERDAALREAVALLTEVEATYLWVEGSGLGRWLGRRDAFLRAHPDPAAHDDGGAR